MRCWMHMLRKLKFPKYVATVTELSMCSRTTVMQILMLTSTCSRCLSCSVLTPTIFWHVYHSLHASC